MLSSFCVLSNGYALLKCQIVNVFLVVPLSELFQVCSLIPLVIYITAFSEYMLSMCMIIVGVVFSFNLLTILNFVTEIDYPGK